MTAEFMDIIFWYRTALPLAAFLRYLNTANRI